VEEEGEGEGEGEGGEDTVEDSEWSSVGLSSGSEAGGAKPQQQEHHSKEITPRQA